jgi:hypothetical protein
MARPAFDDSWTNSAFTGADVSGGAGECASETFADCSVDEGRGNSFDCKADARVATTGFRSEAADVEFSTVIAIANVAEAVFAANVESADAGDGAAFDFFAEREQSNKAVASSTDAGSDAGIEDS